MPIPIRLGRFLLEPLRSFYDVRLYAHCSRGGIRGAFLYLLYMGLIGGVGAAGWLTWSVVPALDTAIGWIAPRMPRLVFTEHGATTEVMQPYVVTTAQGNTFFCVDLGS